MAVGRSLKVCFVLFLLIWNPSVVDGSFRDQQGQGLDGESTSETPFESEAQESDKYAIMPYYIQDDAASEGAIRHHVAVMTHGFLVCGVDDGPPNSKRYYTTPELDDEDGGWSLEDDSESEEILNSHDRNQGICQIPYDYENKDFQVPLHRLIYGMSTIEVLSIMYHRLYPHAYKYMSEKDQQKMRDESAALWTFEGYNAFPQGARAPDDDPSEIDGKEQVDVSLNLLHHSITKKDPKIVIDDFVEDDQEFELIENQYKEALKRREAKKKNNKIKQEHNLNVGDLRAPTIDVNNDNQNSARLMKEPVVEPNEKQHNKDVDKAGTLSWLSGQRKKSWGLSVDIKFEKHSNGQTPPIQDDGLLIPEPEDGTGSSVTTGNRPDTKLETVTVLNSDDMVIGEKVSVEKDPTVTKIGYKLDMSFFTKGDSESKEDGESFIKRLTNFIVKESSKIKGGDQSTTGKSIDPPIKQSSNFRRVDGSILRQLTNVFSKQESQPKVINDLDSERTSEPDKTPKQSFMDTLPWGNKDRRQAWSESMATIFHRIPTSKRSEGIVNNDGDKTNANAFSESQESSSSGQSPAPKPDENAKLTAESAIINGQSSKAEHVEQLNVGTVDIERQTAIELYDPQRADLSQYLYHLHDLYTRRSKIANERTQRKERKASNKNYDEMISVYERIHNMKLQMYALFDDCQKLCEETYPKTDCITYCGPRPNMNTKRKSITHNYQVKFDFLIMDLLVFFSMVFWAGLDVTVSVFTYVGRTLFPTIIHFVINSMVRLWDYVKETFAAVSSLSGLCYWIIGRVFDIILFIFDLTIYMVEFLWYILTTIFGALAPLFLWLTATLKFVGYVIKLLLKFLMILMTILWNAITYIFFNGLPRIIRVIYGVVNLIKEFVAMCLKVLLAILD